jgi:serine/threonine protein kinase
MRNSIVESDAERTFPPRTSHDPKSGKVSGTIGEFGDYELLIEIARGGMGVVCRAHQRSLNRTVALKQILAGELAGPESVRRFWAEAEAVATLNHPNVLPIYEIGERHGQHFFSMKLVEGGNLGGRVSELAGDSGAVANLMAKLARAVEHAHFRGILHRDLKPANVLLDADGTPYITNFGLAKKVGADDGATRTRAALGTPSYMAPEQTRGDKELTPAVDVYGLGAILYELLTTQPPFRGPTNIDTLIQVQEKEAVHPCSVCPTADPNLSLIALKCLEKNPHAATPRQENLPTI